MAETEAAPPGEAGVQKLFGLDGPEALDHIVGRFTPDSAEFQMMDLNESTNVLPLMSESLNRPDTAHIASTCVLDNPPKFQGLGCDMSQGVSFAAFESLFLEYGACGPLSSLSPGKS